MDLNRSKRGITSLDIVWFLTICIIIACFFVPVYKGSNEISNVQNVKADLAFMRTKLGEYKTDPGRGNGSYPEKLSLIAPMYKTGKLPSTPEDKGFTVDNNQALNISEGPINKEHFTNAGGWIYCSSNGTVKANLRDNAWGVKVEWNNQ